MLHCPSEAAAIIADPVEQGWETVWDKFEDDVWLNHVILFVSKVRGRNPVDHIWDRVRDDIEDDDLLHIIRFLCISSEWLFLAAYMLTCKHLSSYIPAVGRFLIVCTFIEDALRIITQWSDQLLYLHDYRHSTPLRL